MKHKLFAAIGAMLLTLCTLTGCGEKTESDPQDDMPYGATIVKNTERDIAVSYDKRFLDDGLVDQIFAYYHAVQTKDAAEFSAALFPLYHAYQMEDVYGGELTDQDLMDSTYDAIAEYFGYDFAFSLLDVTDAITEDYVSPDRDSFLLMLDDLAADKGETPVSEHTQNFYQLTVTRYVTEEGSGILQETDDVLEDETLFAIQYDNEWYLIYV